MIRVFKKGKIYQEFNLDIKKSKDYEIVCDILFPELKETDLNPDEKLRFVREKGYNFQAF